MAYFLYFLRCEDHSIYIGISQDVEKRLSQHRQGKGAKYTKSHPVSELLVSLCCEDKSEALRLEYFSKTWTKKQKEDFVKRASMEELREKYRRKMERKEAKNKKT